MAEGIDRSQARADELKSRASRRSTPDEVGIEPREALDGLPTTESLRPDAPGTPPSEVPISYAAARLQRQSAVLQLQHTLGNAHVQRLVQRSVAQHYNSPASGVPLTLRRQGDAPVTGAGSATSAGAVASDGPTLIVEDATPDLQPGQLPKTQFLAQLRSAVVAAADTGLAGTGRTSRDCPYIDSYLGYYQGQDSTHLERAVRKYALAGATAASANDYVSAVAERVQTSVKAWSATGQITGLPDDLPLAGADPGAPPGEASVPSAGPGPMLKARDGEARDDADPLAIRQQLGTGRALDGDVRAPMAAAFGQDFSDVRVHTGAEAANVSDSLNARAFTIGQDVAFGAGEYRPGTPIGDALIAHELAHVVQQNTSGPGPVQRAARQGANSELEADADTSAAGVLLQLWGQTQGTLAAIAQNAVPRLNSGLTLSRCSRNEEPTPTGTHYDEGKNTFGGSPSEILKSAIPSITRDESASHDEILKHLTTLNAGGTYVFFGHSASDVKTLKVVGVNPSSGHTVTGQQMEDSLKKDSNPPTLVVLGACGTEPLLDNIINGGVPVAVGTSANAANAALASAVGAFMEALAAGNTFAKAKEKGDDKLQTLSPGAEIVVRFAKDFDATMTLKDAKAKQAAGP